MERELRFCLEKEGLPYHLKVDLSKEGFGYVLYAGDPSKCKVIELDSKGRPDDLSSFLGELKALC